MLRDDSLEDEMTTLIETVQPDPLAQLSLWLDEAQARGLKESNAMTLATTTPDGRPSARIVLCKGIHDGAVVFFTNYLSRKGVELDANPQGALCFHWVEFGRQVRIQGRVERVSRAESEAYFATRPRGSQLGAWASRQSQRLNFYDELSRAFDEFEREFAGREVPCPPHWGGYRLVPDRCEFWLAMSSRLHDRIVYMSSARGWEKHQLFP
jgi:pyridoxamine 5'-phosphate oxidase